MGKVNFTEKQNELVRIVKSGRDTSFDDKRPVQ